MRNIDSSMLVSVIPTQQRRFYILIAMLILSNFETKSVYALSGYCDTDTTRTCYTCNPGAPGTMDEERYKDLIAGQCSDHNDYDVWCKTYESYHGGQIIQHNGNAYKCTTDGWQFTDMPGSDGDDTPVSCNAGYYAKTQTGPCVRCPVANFNWAEPEEDYYVPLELVEATSNGGTKDIYSCYIASGSGSYKNLYMDNTGVFSFTQNCYYGS